MLQHVPFAVSVHGTALQQPLQSVPYAFYPTVGFAAAFRTVLRVDALVVNCLYSDYIPLKE